MSKLDEMIQKSLDEIDEILDVKGNVSKALGDEDLAPNDISDDAPEQDAGEEGEGAPEAGDDADVDSDTEPEQDEAEDEEVEKSLEADLKGDESIREALEVSEFLNTLVKSISKELLDQRSTLSKSIQTTDDSNMLLAKSFAGIAKSQRAVLETQAELLKSIRVLNKRVKDLESQPAVRKSMPTAQAVEKSFAGAPAVNKNALSKAEISAKLFQGVQDGKVESTELLAFESLGHLAAISEAAQAYVNK